MCAWNDCNVTCVIDRGWGCKEHAHVSALGRNFREVGGALTNLVSVLESRDIALPTKVHLVKAMVFPVVMYGCENWAIKKAEHWRIDAFELWCWRRLLRVPWTARRSNQSILRKSTLNTHWKDWCWSWSSSTLAIWYEELTHWKRPWCWARLRTGGEGDDRGWDGWMASLTQWTWVWASSGMMVKDREAWSCSPWGHKESHVAEWLNNKVEDERGKYRGGYWMLSQGEANS